jgi:hypothetical protein
VNVTDFTLVNIQNFISNLGFPVFMCLWFMFNQKKADQRHDKVVNEIKCLESQMLESKLQVGQVLNKAEIPPQEGSQTK